MNAILFGFIILMVSLYKIIALLINDKCHDIEINTKYFKIICKKHK